MDIDKNLSQTHKKQKRNEPIRVFVIDEVSGPLRQLPDSVCIVSYGLLNVGVLLDHVTGSIFIFGPLIRNHEEFLFTHPCLTLSSIKEVLLALL